MASRTVDEGASDGSFTLEEIVSAMDASLARRLDILESKVSHLDNVCEALETKINQMSGTLHSKQPGSCGSSSIPTGSDCEMFVEELNSKDDYPNGTWLGDESNPGMRVRCSITPLELFQMESTCRTPKKMALMLMDFLFDRKTMAYSSLSGGGRHGKQKLDLIKITGIKFHLRHRFGISNEDWRHIKCNMNSKCRTAFNRKLKGMPLGPFRNRFSRLSTASNHEDTLPADVDVQQATDETLSTDLLPSSSTVTFTSDVTEAGGDLMAVMLTHSEVIQTANGPIQILHATNEQMADIKRNHPIQILSDIVQVEQQSNDMDIVGISVACIESDLMQQ